MDYESKKVFLINIIFSAVWVGIIYFISKFMLAYLLPFIIAGILAFLMRKPADNLEKKTNISNKLWRCILVMGVYTLIAAFIFLSVWGIIKFTDTVRIKALIEKAENVFAYFGEKTDHLVSSLPTGARESISSFTSSLPQKVADLITNFLSDIAGAALSFLPAFLISSLVTVVASFYIAKDYKSLVLFLKNVLGRKKYSTLLSIKEILTGSVWKLTKGYLLMSGITLTIAVTGLLIFKVEHPIGIGILVAFIDLLPVLGAGTALIPWSIICFIGGNSQRGILLIILYIIITVVRNFAEPKIIGKKLDINPLLMLITIFVGLKIGSIAGMFILPITVIVIISYYKQQMEKERGTVF